MCKFLKEKVFVSNEKLSKQRGKQRGQLENKRK